jgi:hypothetical protein
MGANYLTRLLTVSFGKFVKTLGEVTPEAMLGQ